MSTMDVGICHGTVKERIVSNSYDYNLDGVNDELVKFQCYNGGNNKRIGQPAYGLRLSTGAEKFYVVDDSQVLYSPPAPNFPENGVRFQFYRDNLKVAANAQGRLFSIGEKVEVRFGSVWGRAEIYGFAFDVSKKDGHLLGAYVYVNNNYAFDRKQEIPIGNVKFISEK